MTLVTLPYSGPGVLLVRGGDDPGIIVNRDLVNNVILANNPAQLGTLASILDPLTYVQFSGDVDVYGLAQTAPVLVDVMPQMVNWSPSPAQSAASLVANGLATTTLQNQQIIATNAPTYGPSTLARQIAQETNIPNNIAATGIPAILSSQVGSIPAQAANTSWGPYTFTFTTGGGYQIVFGPAVAGNACVSDIGILHIDAGGNTTFADRYTISTAGALGNIGVTIRGNLYGNRLQVSGTTASQAWVTAVYPTATTVTGFNAAPVYSRPFIERGEPKMLPLAFDGQVINNTAVAVAGSATSVSIGICQPFSGAISAGLTSATANGTLLYFLRGFTVGGGTGAQYLQYIGSMAGASGNTFAPVYLDQRVHLFQVSNLSTTATTAAGSLVAGDYI